MRIAASTIGFLLLVGFDQGFEAVEAGRPELLPLPEPGFGFLQRAGFHSDQVGAADLAACDQAGVLQHLHVLGSSRESHLEGLGKRTDGLLTEREAGEHPASGRIR